MTSVLEAPAFTKDRAHAREFLADLPRSLFDIDIVVRFVDRTIATTSFVDELVHELLVVREAKSVQLENLNSSLCSVALSAAEDFDVLDRLLCS